MKKSDRKKVIFSLEIFDFSSFSKIKFSPKKCLFLKKKIMYHAQTLQVASRNSPCAARGHGKRILENPKNRVFR